MRFMRWRISVPTREDSLPMACRLSDGANVDEGPDLRTFSVRVEDDKISVLV
jgi:hypothetical protein